MKQFRKVLIQFARKLRKQSEDENSQIKKYDLVVALEANRKNEKPDQSDSSKIHKILEKLAIDSEFLKVIQEKPQALMEEFDLDKEDIKALQAADLLVAVRRINPLLEPTAEDIAATVHIPNTGVSTITNTGFSTVTLDTGSTCTVTNSVLPASMAQTVQALKEKDSIYLSNLIQRLAEDEEFYDQTRSYFGH